MPFSLGTICFLPVQIKVFVPSAKQQKTSKHKWVANYRAKLLVINAFAYFQWNRLISLFRVQWPCNVITMRFCFSLRKSFCHLRLYIHLLHYQNIYCSNHTPIKSIFGKVGQFFNSKTMDTPFNTLFNFFFLNDIRPSYRVANWCLSLAILPYL